MSNEKKKQSKNDGKYEKKQRFVVWLHPTTNESIENMYKISVYKYLQWYHYSDSFDL